MRDFTWYVWIIGGALIALLGIPLLVKWFQITAKQAKDESIVQNFKPLYNDLIQKYNAEVCFLQTVEYGINALKEPTKCYLFFYKDKILFSTVEEPIRTFELPFEKILWADAFTKEQVDRVGIHLMHGTGKCVLGCKLSDKAFDLIIHSNANLTNEEHLFRNYGSYFLSNASTFNKVIPQRAPDEIREKFIGTGRGEEVTKL